MNTTKMLSNTLFSAAMILIFSVSLSCNKKSGPEVADVLMIIYTSKSSTVIRNNKELHVSPGFLLKALDIIKTGNGTMDLQDRNGSIIRLRNFSSLTVESLLKSPYKKTNLQLNEGAMLAKIKKLSSDDEYTVTTPTAIAGVRGTTFSVEIQEEGEPKVRVYDGKVSIKPNIEALENKSSEEIEKNEDLKELKELQENHEVVLESEMEASMEADLHRIVQKINKNTTEQSADSNEKSGEILKDDIQALADTAPVKTKEAPVTQKENNELATLAGADTNLVLQKMDANSANTADDAGAADSEKILASYNQNLGESIKSIETNSNLKSDEDIKNFYNIVEEVVKKDGSKQMGAIVTQIGDQVIFHSSSGVSQIQTDEIDYVDYYTK